MKRILILGPAKTGKSTLARYLSERLGMPHLCTDPQRLCPPGVTGIPDDLGYGGADSEWVVREWLLGGSAPPAVIVEGCALTRAVRKLGSPISEYADALIVQLELLEPYTLPGQERQRTQVENQLGELEMLGLLDLPRETWRPVDGGWKGYAAPEHG
jgi:hypothetical protein